MSLTINSFNNNSIYSLFGSSGSTSSSAFGGLESSLTNLAQIRSGSYGKLVRSYYSKYDSDGNLKSGSSKSSSNADTSNLSKIRNDAADLNKATDKLLAKDKNSIWNETTSTDEEGNVTKSYDKDAIYNAVSDFVKSYNSLVDSGQKADGINILTQVAGMVTISAKSAQTLGKAGITIDSSNHLSVDEDFLKNKANMTYVKDLFNGTGSYAYQIATKASMTGTYASSELSNITGRKSYTSSGDYSLSANDMISVFNTTT